MIVSISATAEIAKIEPDIFIYFLVCSFVYCNISREHQHKFTIVKSCKTLKHKSRFHSCVNVLKLKEETVK